MQIGFSSNPGIDVVLTAIVFLAMSSVALLIREVVRARVGGAFGDRVPRMAGRATPTRGSLFDPLGSVVFPLLMSVTGGLAYSWAKPLSYEIGNPGNRRTVVVSALSGSAANMFSAFLAVLLVGASDTALWNRFLALFIVASVNMAVLHLLPVPPLDGSRIVAVYLNRAGRASYQRIERWGIAILFGIGFILQYFGNEPLATVIRFARRLII
jgi:Zn-dependent protease